MNEQNLKPIRKGQLSKEESRERSSNGGKKSGEVRRAKKTMAQIFQAWAEADTTVNNQELLKTLHIDDKSNKASIIIPIINGIRKGDMKSLQMARDLLNEDKRKDKEIEKLEAEIQRTKLDNERIKLENEKLRKELKGEIQTNQIVIVNDVPKEVRNG